jgi:polyisoprenoid-binding protein YceI
MVHFTSKVPGWLSTFLLLLAGISSIPLNVHGVECQVDTSKANSVIFVSEAPIEDFEGVTDRIDGYVYWEGEALVEGKEYDNSQLFFEVDLNSLDTGIGMRNRHMRDNYLETDKYPYATYTGKLEKVTGEADGEFLVTSSGVLSIHGIEKPYIFECHIYPDDSSYRIQCEFPVSLPDFDIKVPSLMFLKINEKIELKLDFHVTIVQSEN